MHSKSLLTPIALFASLLAAGGGCSSGAPTSESVAQQGALATATSCEALGGECLRSPIDVTYAADCQADYHRAALSGTCAAMNQSCCVRAPNAADAGDGGDANADARAPTCAALGGECRHSPLDVGYAANCEQELGVRTLDGACEAINQSCCAKAP